MKIQLASDLHLEYLQHAWPGERIIGPVPGADVLVLAGDIANGTDACRLFANWPTPSRIPIIYVAGNHEFYGHVMEPMLQKLREGAALNNIHYLENESVEIAGVRFLGATMWTDYQLERDRTQFHQMAAAELGIADHFKIRTGSGRNQRMFKPKDALRLHEISRAWLEEELAKPFNGKTVVVTHHAPHRFSVHRNYMGNPLNSAFVSDLSALMPGVDLWLHGHTHSGFDYDVGHCRVVANPAGYIRNRWAHRDNFIFENETFDRNLLVELAT